MSAECEIPLEDQLVKEKKIEINSILKVFIIYFNPFEICNTVLCVLIFKIK